MKIGPILCAAAVLSWLSARPALAASCESLAQLALKDATITSAQLVPAGQFSAPGERPERGLGPFKTLGDFCRVAATLTPTSDSDIKIEVWLPAANWNGKFQAVGNGGWAGVIGYAAMAEAVRAGYASASTDTGHVGGRGTFALVIRRSWSTLPGARSTRWRSRLRRSWRRSTAVVRSCRYWNGCSTGGRQGLKMAQMFPDDYDGIIAGAPANRTAISLWIADAVLKDPASYIPPSKYPAIHQAAVNACDAGDGLKDGLIGDPRSCHFDPKVLECKAGDGPNCLTAPQVEAARKIYSPAINPRTGKEMFASLVPGTELGWGVQAQGPEPSANIYDQYRYVVFKDPNWDWKTFDFDHDVARGDLPENLIMNATDPNMDRFFARGGKLLMYHGWSDPNVPAVNTIKYFEQVAERLGGPAKAADRVRLFLAPGMGHCGGGNGPNVFDKVSALEQWVEHGTAPGQLLASKSTEGKVERTRPLCPYPQVAAYKGTGSIDEAANFVCRAP